MKTENKIEDAILKITMKIQKQYPELSKYLVEMPVTIPDVQNPEINIKNLQDYYNSLVELLNKYAPNHEKN
jgi:sugar-specific transcriptional regulator TrmB